MEILPPKILTLLIPFRFNKINLLSTSEVTPPLMFGIFVNNILPKVSLLVRPTFDSNSPKCPKAL
ncbi:hypothetical protein DVH24_009673 [Malus domestica]|uniref:Uncharacterized protein n=1 Tax=Malus domestica TaxID=3750 RepID=A0A498JUG9_MALDO|nr:hypothetical protein DVH24_009673 [Malus domestica]